MKRLVAIVMLCIHLFNVGGYMLMQQYQQYRVDRKMNNLISQNLYDPNSLIEVKVAQHLPGINSEWGDYKNINGQLQLKNACYNYVKMKITRDTLYVMVIKNYEKTRLTEKNIIYARQINDIPQGDKSHDTGLKKAGADQQYTASVVEYLFAAFANTHALTVKPLQTGLTNPYLPVAGQPPETAA